MNIVREIRYAFPSGYPVRDGFESVCADVVIELDGTGGFIKSDSYDPRQGPVFDRPILNRTSDTTPRLVDDAEYTLRVVPPKDGKATPARAQKRWEAFVANWERVKEGHEQGCCTVVVDYIDPLLAYLKNGARKKPSAALTGEGGDVLLLVNGSSPFTSDTPSRFDCFLDSLVPRVTDASRMCAVCGESGGHVNWAPVGPPIFGTSSMFEMEAVGGVCATCMTMLRRNFTYIRGLEVADINSKKPTFPRRRFLFDPVAATLPTGGYVDDSVLEIVRQSITGGGGAADDGISLDGHYIVALAITTYKGTFAFSECVKIPASDAVVHAESFDKLRSQEGSGRPARISEIAELLEVPQWDVGKVWHYAITGAGLPEGTLQRVVNKYAHIAMVGDKHDTYPGSKNKDKGVHKQATRIKILGELVENSMEGTVMNRGTALGELARITESMHWNYHRDDPKPSIVAKNLSSILEAPGYLLSVLAPKAVALNEACLFKDGQKSRTAACLRKEWSAALGKLEESGGTDGTPLDAEESALFLIAYSRRSSVSHVDDATEPPTS